MVENRSDMKSIKINTIYIDLDDTIWDFTYNSKITLKEVIEGNQIVSDKEEYDKFFDLYKKKNNELWALYHYGKIEKDYLVTERFRYALEGINYPGDLLQLGKNLNEEYLHKLSLKPTIVDGAEELLQYLSDKYKVGILSNGFKGIQSQKLKSGGLDKYIDLMVLSDDIGVTKPLKEIFDHALKMRNSVPEQTVMIGDNYDADICGANNAGWKTIFFNRRNTIVENNIADFTVNNLAEIKNIL